MSMSKPRFSVHQQIGRANRRLLLQCLLTWLPWTTFLALLVALVAIAAPKVWRLDIALSHGWALLWTSGALVAGLFAAVVGALWRHRGPLDAALEIDSRFGLKERVSSAFSLSAEQRDTAAGQLVWEDAQRQVAGLDIGERFRSRVGWPIALPLATLLILVCVMRFVPDAAGPQAAAADPANQEELQQVRNAVEDLRRRLAARKTLAETQDQKTTETLITHVQRNVDELARQDQDRKQTLVKLNHLAQELAERRQDVEAGQRTRDLLRQLSAAQHGSNDRVTQALKRGDVQAAGEELRKLSDQLKGDGLTAPEMQQLAEQMRGLEQPLQQMLGTRSELAEKQSQLQQRMEQLQGEGRVADAGALQHQLDQLQKRLDDLDRQQPQLSQLQKLADKIGESARRLQDGNSQQSAAQLDQMADQLQNLQRQLQDLDAIDQMMRQIAEAKNSMHCQQCGGKGCAACQNDAPAMALPSGERHGGTERSAASGLAGNDLPHEELNTTSADSTVSATPGPGPVTRVGAAPGANVVGPTRAQVQDEIAGAFAEDPVPLTNQQLPRRERNQAREYFELLRKTE